MHITHHRTPAPSFRRLSDPKKSDQKMPEPDATEMQAAGPQRDSVMVIGGLATTLGAVVYAGYQGSALGSVLGAGVAGATCVACMVAGLPRAMAAHKAAGEEIGNYVSSSAASLTLGVATGAFMGAQGCGILAVAGVGAGAALLGWVGAELI